MPQVRYGPDIADDAAYLMNQILDYQDALAMPKKGRSINKREMERRKRAATRASKMAKEIFGITDKDIAARKFGLMGKLASYSYDGRRVSSRKWNPNTRSFEYQRTTRKEVARSWRSGKLRFKPVEQEFIDRGDKPGRKNVRPDLLGSRSTRYVAHTAPKGFLEAQAAVLRRARERGGIVIGKRRQQIRSRVDLDNLGISKRRRPGARSGPKVSRRPPKSSSVKQKTRRATKPKAPKGGKRPRGK